MICASIATVCLVAPVPFHRIVFRRGMKDHLLVTATRYIATGLTFFFLSMSGGVILVLDFVLNVTTALAVTGGLAVVTALLWLVVPLTTRRRLGRQDN